MNAPRREMARLATMSMLVFALPAQADLIFTKIADSDTSIPGGTGTFSLLGSPAIDGEDVAFANQVFGMGTIGVYSYVNGTLAKVANRDTPIPDGTGDFSGFFASVSISSGVVAFVGHGSSGQTGVYTDPNGLSTVADTSTPIPAGSGTFTAFGDPWIEDGQVVFCGGTGSECGVYLDDGSLRMVADADTPIPPEENEDFSWFRYPALRGGKVAFWGRVADGSPNGVYAYDDGVLSCIADTSTSIPDGSGDFTSLYFSNVSIDDNGAVAFQGKGADSQSGIYTYVNGNLAKVVDERGPFPGFPTRVTELRCPGIDDGNVAFTSACCMSPGGYPAGVYTNLGGSICKIIACGDTLDGRTVHQAGTSRQCISGNRVTFWMSYASGAKYAVYVAYFCPGDLDGDHDVDLSDLAELLGHYGTSGTRTQGDINGDGVIDTTDLEILLTNYAATCSD